MTVSKHIKNKMIDKETIELIKLVITILGPIVGALITYFIMIKGKREDTNIIRINKLNNVLSLLMINLKFLIKLEKICQLKYDDSIVLPIPKDYISLILINSGVLNNKFQELENSIVDLKSYAPLSYIELDGIGKRLDFLNSTFILPLIKSRSTSRINQSLSDKYLKITIDDLRESILSISKKINNEMYRSVKSKLKTEKRLDIINVKNEIYKEYYELTLIVNSDNDITYDEFVSEIENQEYQNTMKQEYEMINHIDIDKLMNICADNPTIRIHEIANEFRLQEMNKFS